MGWQATGPAAAWRERVPVIKASPREAGPAESYRLPAAGGPGRTR